MVKVVIVGAAGRMGRQLITDGLADADLQVVGAVEAEGVPQIGEDIGRLCGGDATGVTVESSFGSVLNNADVVIEFSVPHATLSHLESVKKSGKAYVIGTTGFDASGLELIRQASRDIPILLSPNMSVGINLLASILPSIVKAIDSSYDIEVIEWHHRFKRDAPSGTALMLAGVIEKALGKEVGSGRVYGREGLALRAQGEIGIHAVRAGSNPGEHRVIFANEGEEIEIAHRAFGRQTLSLGALRAAKFVAAQRPGLYNMQDVLAR